MDLFDNPKRRKTICEHPANIDVKVEYGNPLLVGSEECSHELLKSGHSHRESLSRTNYSFEPSIEKRPEYKMR